MVTKHDLYYPLNLREKIAVRLFRADIWPSDFDEIKVKNHFKHHCLSESLHGSNLNEDEQHILKRLKDDEDIVIL